MIPDCDGRSDGRSDGQTESIMAKTALCIASYADALSIKYDKTLQEAQLMQTNYVMLCSTQTVIQSISREDIKQS